jgi:Putative Ig domain
MDAIEIVSRRRNVTRRGLWRQMRFPGWTWAVLLSIAMAGCGGGNSHPPAQLSISAMSPLASATLNNAYNVTLVATGGTKPYAWSIISGNLPSGLALSSAGVISGTPTASGTFDFTVRATDSAGSPQTATSALELQVSGGPLAIATGAIPAAQLSRSYSFQLTASGGVPPYTWSAGSATSLPAGLTLSKSGLISGTPTAVSNTMPGFVVTDSAGASTSGTLALIVTPTPDITYSFVFSGYSGVSSPTPVGANAIVINGTFALKNGVVLSGLFDENSDAGPALIEQPITGGTLTTGANGLGQLVLQIASGSVTFALAGPASAAPGKDSAIRIIEFDDTTGSGKRGSGVLKPSTTPATATSGISGHFALLFDGPTYETAMAQTKQALACSFQTDGAGNIVAGTADWNEAGSIVAADLTGLKGSYSVDTFGHGLLTISGFTPGGSVGGIFRFSFYQVSPGEWLAISIDPPIANSSIPPLFSGSVLQQTGAPFSDASLQGTFVLQVQGLDAVLTGGELWPHVTAGLMTSDGSGHLSFDLDDYGGLNSPALLQRLTSSATYVVDATSGRVGTNANSPVYGVTLYMIDNTRAFALVNGNGAKSGVVELQLGAPFTNASFKGSYLGGSLPSGVASTLNEVGLVSADGNGNVSITSDRSTSQGLVTGHQVMGTYSVDSSGRVVVTAPGDTTTRIFYLVSPTKVAYLTSDGDAAALISGYLGSFAQ